MSTEVYKCLNNMSTEVYTYLNNMPTEVYTYLNNIEHDKYESHMCLSDIEEELEEEDEEVEIAIPSTSSESNHTSYKLQWRCMMCNVDMGPDNPRQLCGKTRCLNVGFIMCTQDNMDYTERDM